MCIFNRFLFKQKIAFIYFSRITVTAFFVFIFHFKAFPQLPPCKDSFPPALLLNSSFEQYSGCNPEYEGSLEGGHIDDFEQFGGITVNNWHTYLRGSPVLYFNYNCRSYLPGSIFDTVSFSNTERYSPKVPLPLPDSSGFIAVAQRKLGDESNSYITSCLSSPLYPQQRYVFTFYFGFGKQQLTNPTYPNASPSPFGIAIFGRQDCPDYPLHPVDQGSEQGCLGEKAGWVELGRVKLTRKNEWVQGVIEFTPQIPISCIGIGPDCTGDYILKDTTAYYFMDKFTLASEADFSFKTIKAISGNVCTGNFVLKAPAYPNGVYQWYKDGAAIPNSNSYTYTVPNSSGAAGSYQANVSLAYNTCLNILPYNVWFSDVKNFKLGNDTTLCAPSGLRIDAYRPGAKKYLWQDGSEKYFLNVNQTGEYAVELTDADGCSKKDSINVTIQNCDVCDIYIPTAFTPNNDGLNDMFRAFPKCTNIALESYKMRIYNRWGQLVFTGNNINESWDGKFKKQLVGNGIYVYYIEYAFKQHPLIKKKGTIELLR